MKTVTKRYNKRVRHLQLLKEFIVRIGVPPDETVPITIEPFPDPSNPELSPYINVHMEEQFVSTMDEIVEQHDPAVLHEETEQAKEATAERESTRSSLAYDAMVDAYNLLQQGINQAENDLSNLPAADLAETKKMIGRLINRQKHIMEFLGKVLRFVYWNFIHGRM